MMNCAFLLLYRSPFGSYQMFIETLIKILDILIKQVKYVRIVGDFNVDFLENSTAKCDLLNLFKTYGLHATIKSPTRISISTSTCIDKIVTNNLSNLKHGYTLSSHMSNHHTVLADFDLSIIEHNRMEFIKRPFTQFGK